MGFKLYELIFYVFCVNHRGLVEGVMDGVGACCTGWLWSHVDMKIFHSVSEPELTYFILGKFIYLIENNILTNILS